MSVSWTTLVGEILLCFNEDDCDFVMRRRCSRALGEMKWRAEVVCETGKWCDMNESACATLPVALVDVEEMQYEAKEGDEGSASTSRAGT